MSSLKDSLISRKQLKGKAYWRSLGELAETPEFAELLAREFPEIATEALSPATRRSFLKYMGASLALAGLALTGCRWPEEKITPYANRPDGFTPGTPERYATAMELGGCGVGLVVTSYDGRPIKIEGNPLHSGSLGSAGAWQQASLLELYDPSRATQPLARDGAERTPRDTAAADEFLAGLGAELRSSQGQGLALLLEESCSPTVLALRDVLRRTLPETQFYTYEPVSRDTLRQALKTGAGMTARPVLHFDRATAIISFDDDFLLGHPNAVRQARDFVVGRAVDNSVMNRLYMVESTFSLTGMNADHRVPVMTSIVGKIAGVLAAELFINRGLPLPPAAEGLRSALEPLNDGRFKTPLIAAMARDLLATRGQSLLTAGPRQTAAVHVLVNLLNEALGNVGATVDYITDPRQDDGDLAAIGRLAEAIDAGAVETLIICGGNPAYNAPADLAFAAKLAKTRRTIHLSHYDNETSQLCGWHLPRAHYLEAWGDALAWDGSYSVVQPLIAPFYGGLSEIELLARLADARTTSGYELVQETFQQRYGAENFETRWRAALHDGLVAGSQAPSLALDLDYANWPEAVARLNGPLKDESELELVLLPDYSLYDGRFANNGWLQELPDPLSKVTWDNAVMVSIYDAERLGLAHGDLVELSSEGRTITAPVYVMPGQPPYSLALALGYGRYGDLQSPQSRKLDALDPHFKDIPRGLVCTGVGVSAYQLRTSGQPDVLRGVSLRRTGQRHELACTQDHYAIDTVGLEERGQRVGELVREANLDFYQQQPDFAQRMSHHPPLASLWREHEYEGHRWGLAVDLNSCIGCGACITACQAENNIPVVGKRRVAEGREMHWIRVDRYFSGNPERPLTLTQPVTCHHCEMAPCEQVCPVAATVHSSEGLNDMVYNRCVGTRYCSNNCPYKVRRFNYFAYNLHLSEAEKLKFNPEVTVRSRGVMEKCTFCVQRIQGAKIDAKNAQRELTDGEITPACAQTCPAQAITFGDLNDPNSRVRQLHDSHRAYAMLAELNIKPRVAYLAKIRNPAPGTPEHAKPEPHLFEHEESEQAAGDNHGEGEH